MPRPDPFAPIPLERSLSKHARAILGLLRDAAGRPLTRRRLVYLTELPTMAVLKASNELRRLGFAESLPGTGDGTLLVLRTPPMFPAPFRVGHPDDGERAA